MKKIVLMLVLAVMFSITVSADDANFAHGYGLVKSVTMDTINTQHTIGSYQGVCSLATFTALDSGDVFIEVTGIANLSQGQKLYIALDSANGIVDTIYGQTNISVPYKTWSPMKVPFYLGYSITKDSNATVIAPALNMASGSSTDAIVVEKIKLKVYMISNKIN